MYRSPCKVILLANKINSDYYGGFFFLLDLRTKKFGLYYMKNVCINDVNAFEKLSDSSNSWTTFQIRGVDVFVLKYLLFFLFPLDGVLGSVLACYMP